MGTSTNAVKTQIWTALICMLLLRYRYSGRLDNTFSLPLLASCVDLAASAVTRPSASPLDEPPPQATSDKDAVTTSAARGIRVENMVSLRHLWWPPSAFRAQWGMQARVQPNTLVMADCCSLRTRCSAATQDNPRPASHVDQVIGKRPGGAGSKPQDVPVYA